MNDVWNPWHGCTRYSEGCKNCYVYRRDESVGRDPSVVRRTTSFDYPLKKYKNGNYRIPAGSSIFCCMTSDFFIVDADQWRGDIWNIMRQRSDVEFTIITKRIMRFYDCIPPDWNDGYDNVTICCTIENQKQCDIRFPFFNEIPVKHKMIICEPLLQNIDMSMHLNRNIDLVVAGGESGNNARECNFDWILNIRKQCIEADVPFYFKQTGAKFIKDGRLYNVKRRFQHQQAKKAEINYK